MEENIHHSLTRSSLIEESTAPNFDEIMVEKSNHVLGLRWFATFIDFAVLASFLVVPDFVLGNDIYRETIAIWLSLVVLYFPIMEGFTGYSIGKFIFRVKVIDKNGNNPGIVKSIIRTLLRVFEVNPFIAGGIPAGLTVLFSKKGQRVGDMLAGTYVASVSLVDKYSNQLQSTDKGVDCN